MRTAWTCHSSLWKADSSASLDTTMRSWFKVLPLLTLWVVYSEAWFWSWSETGTTLAPGLELEGSGIATGSGEPLSESSTTAGAETIDEGHVLQTVGQTWDETTEGPRVTTVVPSTPPERGRGVGQTTAGTTSRRSKPGNDIFSCRI